MLLLSSNILGFIIDKYEPTSLCSRLPWELSLCVMTCFLKVQSTGSRALSSIGLTRDRCEVCFETLNSSVEETK